MNDTFPHSLLGAHDLIQCVVDLVVKYTYLPVGLVLGDFTSFRVWFIRGLNNAWFHLDHSLNICCTVYCNMCPCILQRKQFLLDKYAPEVLRVSYNYHITTLRMLQLLFSQEMVTRHLVFFHRQNVQLVPQYIV